MAESFFATLKTEFYYRRVWPAKKRARLEVDLELPSSTVGAHCSHLCRG